MTHDPDKTVKEEDFKFFKSFADGLRSVNFYFRSVEYQGPVPPHTVFVEGTGVYKLRTIRYSTPKGFYSEQVYVLEERIGPTNLTLF